VPYHDRESNYEVCYIGEQKLNCDSVSVKISKGAVRVSVECINILK
jgi:hypothetical protein